MARPGRLSLWRGAATGIIVAFVSYPVVFGLPTGHGGGVVTLPLGVRARLAGERLSLLESPLSESGR